MAIWTFSARDAQELDQQLRQDVLALDNLHRTDEIHGEVHVFSNNPDVKRATTIPVLQARGIKFTYHETVMPQDNADEPQKS